MNILIVDDNPIDIELIKLELSSSILHKHDISEAKSVAEGLVIVKNNRFDVILLDYHMPECDGIEMLIELRSKPNLGNTAIIIVSASSDVALALECLEAGAQDFLPKNELTQVHLLKAIIHSRKRFELEQKMHLNFLTAKNAAEKDPLTGVFNRLNFEENLNVMMKNAQRSEQTLGLLILDLDNFKNINDTLGHDAGDELLKGLVARINTCLRANEVFARLGGDEFAIILGNITAISQIYLIGQRILDTFIAPFLLLGNSVSASASIGAAIFPNDSENGKQLLKCADIALYRAKQQGKNKLCFFEHQDQIKVDRRFAIQSDMTKSMGSNSFLIYFQPIFDSGHNKVLGAEVLLRWPDAATIITPSEFIAIAEESGQICVLGKWVIDTALKQLREFQSFTRDFILSINVSPKQLHDPSFSQYLLDSCIKHHVQPQNITLEITETALLKQNSTIREAIQTLHNAGFTIALNDFGMSFSSISHLIDYPVGQVKLSKSLLSEDNNHTHKKKVIFEAIVLMLKRFDLPIVAQGIEEKLHLDFCQSQNIDRLQGDFLGLPMLPNKFLKILKSNKPLS